MNIGFRHLNIDAWFKTCTLNSNCALQISEPPCDVQMQEVVYFQEKKMQEVTEFARRISVACVTEKKSVLILSASVTWAAICKT